MEKFPICLLLIETNANILFAFYKLQSYLFLFFPKLTAVSVYLTSLIKHSVHLMQGFVNVGQGTVDIIQGAANIILDTIKL